MISCALHPSLFALWAWLIAFLDRPFTSAFLSALAGAGAGAWAAQRIAERSSKRAELLEMLRQANAVLVLAYTIANNTLNLKSQHIVGMTGAYLKERELASAVVDALAKGRRPSGRPAQLDLTKITPHSLPLDALRNLMFSGSVMPGKALALATMVDQSAAELAQVLSLRNELIEHFKNSTDDDETKWHDYFGFARRDGNTNAMYQNCMEAIQLYTNDLIFFSSELATELGTFAQRVKSRLDKLKAEAPKAGSVSFSDAEAKGLMPLRSDYESWLSGIQSAEEPRS